MTISRVFSAACVLYCAAYTAINLAFGGEPSIILAMMAVAGVVQYALLE